MQEQQSRSEKDSRVSNQYNKSNSSKYIQLQVNISIGKNKFLLQVPKCANLHEEVQKFLKQHKINLKYQGPILSMVREQLAKKQQQKLQNLEIQELKRIKTQMENKKNQADFKQKLTQNQQKQQNREVRDKKSHTFSSATTIKQNKQNYINQFNSNHTISIQQNQSPTNIPKPQKQKQKQKQQKITAQQAKCQNVYQRWKMKQKIKQTQKLKNNTSTSTSILKRQVKDKDKSSNKSILKQQQKNSKVPHKKLETHSPDYFYNKGVKFQQAKQTHVEQLYKQRYPFQLNRDASLTPTKKSQLHERLYKEHQVKLSTKNIKYTHQKQKQKQKQKERQKQETYKPKLALDKYKQKVIERDNKIDEALGYLLDRKMIQNPYKIQLVPRSPFRKTNL